MGNDGGSIPTRRELVKEAARNPTTSQLKELQNEQQEHYWNHDPVSRKPLAQPVVSDAAGKLYNKDTILEYLVEGTRKEEVETETRGAVKSLKDVVELKFDVDGDADKSSKKAWKCPVTGDRLGPGSKAVYLVPCGHVFSGTAIKEVSGEKCLTCETEYASNDIVPILPVTEMDVARLLLRAKTLQEKGLTHSLKKAAGGGKKRKKRDEQVEVSTKDETTPNTNGKPNKTATPAEADEGTLRINNSSTASVTAKVKEEQERSKKRKTENANVKSLFSNRDDSKHHGKSSDFMTRGFTVPAGAKR